ncbi:fasciclin-like arabinogalactan protein 12 [Ricinus communis]|uniref:fasciclin-like arabinogalactan protein 12 n=1 Tax=Ricinus communis TaxID=3988 RepID=UPI000D6982C2|nr:fasciclin-like arabinogalactan protein 12 [Ricinus communis]|eukprot:XP_025015485.1 fasciclin-like arabinogalactan protein 12 [Ricinus communis]
MQPTFFTLLLLFLFLQCTITLSQPPAPSPVAAPPAQSPAQAPAKHPPHHPHSSPPPPEPADIIQVLLKASHFTSFARLIKATHVDYQLTAQLNSSSDGITMFAPTDAAFSNLRESALSSLNDKEKVAFVQFHILPRFLSTSDFQTLSNPIKTLAGSDSRYPMTITTTDSSVNISTGLTETSIANTVYSDNRTVVVYEIDKVLLPKYLFPPAAAPAAAANASAESPEIAKEASGAIRSVLQYNSVVLGVGIFAVIFCL